MNLDIINIGHYRLTSHGGRAFDMFNRKHDTVYDLNKEEFDLLKRERSIEACHFVYNARAMGVHVKDEDWA